MKNFIKLFGIIALVAVIGFTMAACENGNDSNSGGGNNNNSSGNNNNSGGNNNNNSGSSNEKSIKITGLGDLVGYEYTLGLAPSVENFYNMKGIVAYAEGTIRSGTQTAQLLDWQTDAPWTGSGSYYVGVYLDGYGEFVTKSKKSFNSSVTTLSFDDFDYAD